MIINEEDYLKHYGTPRKSGRYPWGSGEDPGQHNKNLLAYVNDMRKQGLSEADIANGLDITTTKLRAMKSIAKNEQKQGDISMAQRLHDKGLSNVAIGTRMGVNESSVRSLLNPGQKDRADVLKATSNMLKEQVAQKEYIDIGTGVENHIGVSQTKLSTAVSLLQEEGYGVHYVKVQQLGTGQQTTIKVLAGPNVPYSQVFHNRDQIKQITNFTEDGGRSFLGVQDPLSVSSNRVHVRYAEQGGGDADGVIYVRPGVEDVSLGSARYAQVRVAVDNSHYLKGMAMYKNDLPAGTDLMFNTNKSDTGNKLDAMKPMKDDPDNPFGAVIHQRTTIGSDGKVHVTSAMNIVGSNPGSGEEGSWDTWSRNLSSQMLSKQSPTLAKTQLNMTYEAKKSDLAEISSLTNPAVRKKLLESFADDVDSSAVHLKAAALPRQGSHVILPVNSLKETEIYAPNYRNGERVVLIRYPHGGVFEIPELTVNNRHPQAKTLLGNAKDAVGINSKVAARLSGADFDGDTVLVIPNNNHTVKTEPALAGLKDFDPQKVYKPYDGMPTMDGGTWDETLHKVVFEPGKKPTSRTKQIQMGIVSNLITDMTIQGAGKADLARAVRHSMVVIDAEKHSLNYKLSAEVNGIADLKTKYQGSARSGASTLISRASAEIRVLDRKPQSAAKGGPVDKATGQKMFENTNVSYVDAKGKTIIKTIKSQKLAETTNAHTLVSKDGGTKMEKVYADHSNKLKALANTARKAAVAIKTTPYSPSAKSAYSNEVVSLNAKLNLAIKNRPLERQAQIIGNATVSMKKAANPNMDLSELKKIRSQALAEARTRTQAKKPMIDITPQEWHAIQAGAVSNHILTQILNNADLEQVKKLATPKTNVVMTTAKMARASSMIASGYTQSEVADALGVPLSTLKSSLKGVQ